MSDKNILSPDSSPSTLGKAKATGVRRVKGAFAQTDKNSHRIFVRSWFCVGFSQIVAFQF